MSWSEFLRAHWGAIAACDFFTVEALTFHGLVRYHVFVVIDLASRRVEIGGITGQPTGEWMVQVARSLLDYDDSPLCLFRSSPHARRRRSFRTAVGALARIWLASAASILGRRQERP